MYFDIRIGIMFEINVIEANNSFEFQADFCRVLKNFPTKMVHYIFYVLNEINAKFGAKRSICNNFFVSFKEDQ